MLDDLGIFEAGSQSGHRQDSGIDGVFGDTGLWGEFIAARDRYWDLSRKPAKDPSAAAVALANMTEAHQRWSTDGVY